MQALVLTAPSQLEVLPMPDPIPAEDEVLLRIHACGICGSDIHGWDGSTGRRRPPLIMGHEAAGEVLAAGPRATGWRPGDRVTFDSTISCGACPSCAAGQVNLCAHRRVVGVAPAEYRQHGAFAERLALPARILYRLPDSLPYPEAAMVEPVSIAVHAVTRWREALRGRGEEPTGQPVVVIGAGMIGLLVIQALRWAGAGEIIAVDLADNRLELARRLGATQAINSGRTDAAAAVAAATGGEGAAAAFEVVGYGPTLNLALATVRRGGACVLVGNLAPVTQDFPLQAVVTRELTLLGSCASAGEYPLCLDLIARGVIDVRPMIETVAPLAAGPEWFARLSARDGGRYMKVILQP